MEIFSFLRTYLEKGYSKLQRNIFPGVFDVSKWLRDLQFFSPNLASIPLWKDSIALDFVPPSTDRPYNTVNHYFDVQANPRDRSPILSPLFLNKIHKSYCNFYIQSKKIFCVSIKIPNSVSKFREEKRMPVLVALGTVHIQYTIHVPLIQGKIYLGEILAQGIH